MDKTMEQANNKNEIPSVESKNNTDTHLQQLNENCLLKIFSQKSLTLLDLCSLAETCVQFRQITQRIAPETVEIEKDYRDYIVNFIGWGSYREREDVDRIFKHFASNLFSISISNYSSTPTTPITPSFPIFPTDEENFLLNLIARRCDENLKSLSVKGITVPDIFAVKTKQIFMQLQILHLEYVQILSGVSVFAELHSLVTLTVREVRNCSVILGSHFPKLECFTYENSFMTGINTDHEEQTLSFFISLHVTLKKLQLKFYCDESFHMRIPQLIGDSCKELNELHLQMESSVKMSSLALQPLRTLKSLRLLKLFRVSFEDFKLFSTLAELRELYLFHCHTPDDLDEFAYLAQLPILTLHYGCLPEKPDIAGIISRLINLEDFTITAGKFKWNGQAFYLGERTFFEIVRLVEDRPNILKLKCKYNFDVVGYGENQKVKLLRFES